MSGQIFRSYEEYYRAIYPHQYEQEILTNGTPEEVGKHLAEKYAERMANIIKETMEKFGPDFFPESKTL